MLGEIQLNISNSPPKINKVFQSSLSRIFFIPSEDNSISNCVFVNQAGGVHENDSFLNNINVNHNAHLKFTSQAAEKIYLSKKKISRIENNFYIKQNSHLSFLPQELIFFNKSKLKKKNNIHIEKNSSFLLVEQFVMGREFSNEKINDIFFNDQTDIFFDKKVIYSDRSQIDNTTNFNKINFINKNIQTFANIIFFKDNVKKLDLKLNKFFKNEDYSGFSYPSNSLLICKFLDNNTLKLKINLYRLINFLTKSVLNKKNYLNKNLYF